MVRGTALLLLIFSASDVRSQQQNPIPVIENGYVTRTTSLVDFDVNGFHVIPGKIASFFAATGPHSSTTTRAAPYLGQSVTIFGTLNKKHHQVIAENVLFHGVDTTLLNGFALVERIVAPTGPASDPLRLLLRVDGYVILINATTKVTFQSPLTSIREVKTNVWLKYHGKLQSDGFLLADTAIFSSNTIPDSEAKLLDKNDYDPAAVDPNSKQNIARWLLLGIDPKKIPPYKDAAMQARIDRIGSSLIPAYQRNLPDNDPLKILFKFQLIDASNWKDALTLPTGIILVPFQLIERLQNDSQIATLLADNIATALEKQTYRAQPGRKKMAVAEIASAVGGLSTLGATSLITSSVANADKHNAEDQSGRVSLGLLHDAGYDIAQAPITWWLLAESSARDLSSISLPPRAANLYRSLGVTWHNYAEASTAPSSTLQTK
jgi:hypothetical protein